MRRLLTAAAAGLVLAAAPATTAHAAAGPAEPIAGCGAGFQLFSVKELSRKFPSGAAVFAREDTNGDGQVCVRFDPPQQGEGGVVEDNNAVGRG